MSMRTDAVKIVSRYFLKPGEVIEDVEEDEGVVFVSARYHSWDVRPIERLQAFVRSPGYELYGVETDPHARLHGVAVLPDHRMFHLNDAEEIRAFFAAARSLLAPLEVAVLVVAFQSAGGGEGIIMRLEELITRLEAKQIAAHPITPPAVVVGGDGSMNLDFYSMFISRVLGAGFKVNLNRWHVEASAAGQLDWSVAAVARDLESPFYSPKTAADASRGSVR